MNKEKQYALCFLVGLCCLVVNAAAQNYDYHREESSAISWNGTTMFDARMLAAGGISFMASAPFAAVINPALLPKESKFNLGLSLANTDYEAFQYWGINQGVYTVPEAQSDRNKNVSGLSFSLPFKKFRLSAGWYIADLLVLPDFNFDYRYWAYSGKFSGRENNFFAAAAFAVGRKLDVGVKIDYISGSRDVLIDEYHKYYRSDGNPVDSFLLIERAENHNLGCIVPTIGAQYRFSPSWAAAAAVVYPFRGKADRKIWQTFDNQYWTPITITQTGSDTLYRPAKIYLGTDYTTANRHAPRQNAVTIAAELAYILWEDYKYIYFSEEMPRDMRNCLVFASGLEYGIYKPAVDYFLRAGYRFDPQPVDRPHVSLHTFSCGTGFRFGHIAADIGIAYYIAPSDMLSQRHFVVNASFSIDR